MAAPENLAVQADKAAPESLDVIETPTSPSSGLALSRFEFETGKANDGTKILMVEWDGSVGKAGGVGQRNAEARGDKGSEAKWEISWDGKPGILQVRDDSDDDDSTCRVYFLLPPGAAVPPLVTIAWKGEIGSTDSASNSSILRTKPMPAIFPAELGGDEGAGRRGVLHTIWAKKRLVELEAEIAAEMKENGESVGLEMAIQERQWIVDHFGLKSEHGAPEPTALRIPQASISPISPKSPIGGRLGERLRGLKLATSPSGLAAATHGEYLAPLAVFPCYAKLGVN